MAHARDRSFKLNIHAVLIRARGNSWFCLAVVLHQFLNPFEGIIIIIIINVIATGTSARKGHAQQGQTRNKY